VPFRRTGAADAINGDTVVGRNSVSNSGSVTMTSHARSCLPPQRCLRPAMQAGAAALTGS
jgi:hypothetical protein